MNRPRILLIRRFVLLAVFLNALVLGSWALAFSALQRDGSLFIWLQFNTFLAMAVAVIAAVATTLAVRPGRGGRYHGTEFAAPPAAALLVGLVVVTSAELFPAHSIATWFVITVVGAGFSLFASRFVTLERDDGWTDTARSATETTPAEQRPALHLRMAARAGRYRREGRVALFAILLTLVGGATIFVAADALAVREFGRSLQDLSGDLADVRLVATSLQTKFDSIVTLYDALVEADPPPEFFFSTADAVENFLLNDRVTTLFVRGRILADTAGYGEFQSRLITLAEQNQRESSTRTILSSLSTRVGAVLLLVFLVQILTGLYRYSARMASHYEARADLFELEPRPTEAVSQRLLLTLAPDNVDFGPQAKAPIEELRELVETLGKVIAARSQ